MIGGPVSEQIEIDLRDKRDNILTVYIDVLTSSLSKKWLESLNHLLQNQYHLEKNYCFFGFADGERNADLLCQKINASIAAINLANLGYTITDYFTPANTLQDGPIGDGLPGRKLIRDKFNDLHRYFEDLQGVSGNMSRYYLSADPTTRWHIRQLNLLCHEFESWALSYRKQAYCPEWQRPSQLMCWLNAPRFVLDEEDFELFGIDTIARPLGGVFVGVNKAVGKHHWEVFMDEGRDKRLGELTTTVMRGQTEAAGDFDIEWANNPGNYHWMQKDLADFRAWLQHNGFDPNDKSLTIGHPQCAQVDLVRSFGTDDYKKIWSQLSKHLDVIEIRTSSAQARYDYRWSDNDFVQKQVERISQGK